MKWYFMILAFIFSTLVIPSHVQAIDQESILALEQDGNLVKLGELTGAGGKMSLNHLKGLIHPKGVIFKEEIQKMTLSTSSAAQAQISDIIKVQIGNREIHAKEFEGFFIQK